MSDKIKDAPANLHLVIGKMKYAKEVHGNVEQEIIITTADKVNLCLIKHLEHVNRRQAWIAPAGILITVGVVIPTSKFHDAAGLSGDVWTAFFVFVLVAAAIWLAWALFHCAKSHTIEDVVKEMKGVVTEIEEAPATPVQPPQSTPQ